MSADQPGLPGAEDLWGPEELDELLANPEDASRLVQLLAAAGAPVDSEQLPGEAAALIAFRAAFAVPVPVPVSPRRSRFLVSRLSGRVAVAALAGGLVLGGGAAAAAAGVLPGPAQQAAKGVLAKVGVSVPGPGELAGGRRDVEGGSNQAPDISTGPTGPASPAVPSPNAVGERPGKGSDVSGVARGTASTGVDKGAAVSGTASNGKSQAGQHGNATRPSAAKKTPAPQASHRPANTHRPGRAGVVPTAAPKTNPGNAGGRAGAADQHP